MRNRAHHAAHVVLAGVMLLTALPAAAGGGAESGGASGEVVVLITDHREAIDDFTSLVVTIDGARLHRRGRLPEEGWVVLATARSEVDLTRYQDGATFELLRAEAPAARYDAAGLLAADNARGVVPAGDAVEVPLEISPARLEFEVRLELVTELTFDLIVHDLRDHPGKTWGVLLDEVRVATLERPPSR